MVIRKGCPEAVGMGRRNDQASHVQQPRDQGAIIGDRVATSTVAAATPTTAMAMLTTSFVNCKVINLSNINL